MLHAFNAFIKKHQLCLATDKILVAVSGGVDSVVLLDLLVKAHYNVVVAHCNFKLRGKESDEDEQFVRSVAAKYRVDCFVKTCPADDFSSSHNVTIQESARELRYAFFKALTEEKGFDKVAVAHHADDDLETLFINLMRGSGLQGLKGMPVQRDNIIRPLMFISRQQIENYANQHDLSWRNDSSNDSDKYLRNKIRHHLLPVLKDIAPNFNTINQSLSYLKEDAMVLESLINAKKDEIFKARAHSILIPFKKLKSDLPGSLWLFYLLKDFGFSRKESGKIYSAFQSRAVGKHFFSEDFELLVDRESFILRVKKVQLKETFFVEEGCSGLTSPFEASISLMSGSDLNPTQLTDVNIAWLDYQKLTFPLTIRKWKVGDRFHPYGMKGSKLLSDFFTDIKLTLFEKEDTWLLVSGSEIVWVVGYRIAEPYKVSVITDKVLCVKLNELE